MIVLYTDFSLNGPYVGQMKAVINDSSAKSVVIDLMHDAPKFNIRAAAYLLASIIHTFPKNSVFLAVVDPGVGSLGRKPCVVKTDNAWFVGPDNGLFNRVVLESEGYKIWEIDIHGKNVSESFHGRDVFAAIAAQIDQHPVFDGIAYTPAINNDDWPESLFEVIYSDHFGNVMTGVKAISLSTSDIICINGHQLTFARTFSEVPVGDAFWYVNSNAMIEFSVNQGRADLLLNVAIGNTFFVKR